MNFKNIINKYQKYLPSKKFTVVMLAGIIFLFVIFLFLFNSSGNKSFISKLTGNNGQVLKIENQTVTELIKQDTDKDGISDWEEALWGTDKNNKATFAGAPDATYIANKKKELNIEQNVNVTKLTETEKFAREFFASFNAMNTSGEVDKDTINSFSNALGQKIVNPILTNQYTEKDAEINNDIDSGELETKFKYYQDMQTLFATYQKAGIGDELDIVNSGLAASATVTNSDPYTKLPIIAKAYQDFAKKMMNVSVPEELVSYHLEIANSSNNTGASVLNMAQIIKDPLVGLEGISQYQKYSEELVNAVANLETILMQE